MAHGARSYASSSDDASSASDSEGDDAPLRSKPRVKRTQAAVSPVIWGVVAVLVIVVAVLVVVIVRQQMGGSSAAEVAAGGSASGGGGAATGGGGVGGTPTASKTTNDEGGGATATKTRSTGGEDDEGSPTRSPLPSGGGGGGGGDDDNDSDGAPSKSRSSSGASPSSTSTPSNSSLPGLSGEQLFVDFSTFSSSDTVESFLSKAGLVISVWPVDFTPISVMMTPDNVDIVDGALRLKVTGQTGSGQVQSAEVATAEQAILYGKVTTRAKASPVAGVWCVSRVRALSCSLEPRR